MRRAAGDPRLLGRTRPSEPSRPGRDAGLTLAELLVASVVGMVVLSMVSAVYLLALRTEGRVVSATAAVSEAQATVAGIEGGLRNSAVDGVQISAGGDRLVVHTRAAGDPGSWECRAWLFVPDPGQGTSMRSGVLYATTASLGNDLASVGDPRAAGWAVAVSAARVDAVLFQPAAADVVGAWGGRAADKVTIAFRSTWEHRDPGDVQGHVVRKTVTPQQQDQDGDGGCFA